MKRAKKLMLGGLVLLLVLVGAFWVLGISAKSNLAKQYPPPGQLVDIGGYKLHIHCAGQGGPAVVMDAGLNEFSVQWAKIQTEVSKFSRACAYDRAGFGWSEASPYPRTSETMVKELHALLEKSKIDGPYILVGHSFGGMNMRLYANQFPGDVVGLVLVDSAHEEQSVRVPVLRKLQTQTVEQFHTLSKLAAVGLLALSPEEIPDRGLAGEALAQYRAILTSSHYFDTASTETEALETSFSQVRAVKISALGNIPLVVLSRGLADPLPGISESENHHYEQSWKTMQGELLKLSPKAKQTIATRSSHYIHLTEPQLLVDAIRSVSAQAQNK